MSEISSPTKTYGAKPRVVFFGNERIATAVETTCPTVTKLITNGYEIAAIVVNNERASSRKERKLEIADVAARFEIPLLTPDNPSEIIETLRAYKADVGVLVAYGKIVPQELIDIFPAGIINIHPSLLPLHRGSTPIESVLLSEETTTGVSLMQLSAKMDAGDVYAYSSYELSGTETKQELADELLELGSEMVLATIDRIVAGEILGAPQYEGNATYDTILKKTDGKIDLKKTAVQLEKEVRAYLGWPGSQMSIAGKDVVITAAHVSQDRLENVANKSTLIANKQLCLQTSDGVLVVDSLKPAGKAEMSASAFLAGYGTRL